LQLTKVLRFVFTADDRVPNVTRQRIHRVMAGDYAADGIVRGSFKDIKSRKVSVVIFVKAESVKLQYLLSVKCAVKQFARFLMSDCMLGRGRLSRRLLRAN